MNVFCEHFLYSIIVIFLVRQRESLHNFVGGHFSKTVKLSYIRVHVVDKQSRIREVCQLKELFKIYFPLLRDIRNFTIAREQNGCIWCPG
jgi:hypothetical protein